MLGFVFLLVGLILLASAASEEATVYPLLCCREAAPRSADRGAATCSEFVTTFEQCPSILLPQTRRNLTHTEVFATLSQEQLRADSVYNILLETPFGTSTAATITLMINDEIVEVSEVEAADDVPDRTFDAQYCYAQQAGGSLDDLKLERPPYVSATAIQGVDVGALDVGDAYEAKLGMSMVVTDLSAQGVMGTRTSGAPLYGARVRVEQQGDAGARTSGIALTVAGAIVLAPCLCTLALFCLSVMCGAAGAPKPERTSR